MKKEIFGNSARGMKGKRKAGVDVVEGNM